MPRKVPLVPSHAPHVFAFSSRRAVEEADRLKTELDSLLAKQDELSVRGGGAHPGSWDLEGMHGLHGLRGSS